jgi:hypothetical protein
MKGINQDKACITDDDYIEGEYSDAGEEDYEQDD